MLDAITGPRSIAVGEVTRPVRGTEQSSLYHKNLQPVTYVTGDLAGGSESPVYAILQFGPEIDRMKAPDGYSIEAFTARQPFADERYALKWDGEWHITYEVFRDLGAAFAVVLVVIYLLIIGWFQSFKVPLLMMVSIPLSLIGILAGHWIMGAFFTATSMIGMIALAGIMVRNSVLLIDFIDLRLAEGTPLARAIIESGRSKSAADLFEALHRLKALKRTCDEVWQRVDCLLTPTAGTIYTKAAVAEDPVRLNTNLGYYTNFVNLLDLCALAVPGAFRADGLPAGVTLIGQAHDDHALSAIGARFHRASGVRMGATRFELPPSAPLQEAPADNEMVVAVVGAHLSGLPLNHQLTSRGARLLQAAHTAPCYRLYALPGSVPPKPGLVRVAEGGASIAVELWALSAAAFGSFVGEVPPPLAIGTLILADGRTVKGFVCESCAVSDARDISSFGGWRSYLAQQAAHP